MGPVPVPSSHGSLLLPQWQPWSLARGSTPCLYGELLEGVSTPDSEPLAGMGDSQDLDTG